MILNATLLDYIRLTTYEPNDYEQLRDVWKHNVHKDDCEDAGFLQYNGKRWAHGFFGSGLQRGEPHWLFELSGTAAAIAWPRLKAAELGDTKCTRIDIQITIPLPPKYDAHEFWKNISGKLPHGRKAKLVKSGDGLDTVYIGSRRTQNGRLTRIYVKEFVNGLALRFETEFMGTWANDYWHYLRQGGDITAILLTEIESIGLPEISPLGDFFALLDGRYPAPRPRAVETSNPTLDWLLNTCDPAIRRMLRDHDHGSKVRHWLESLLDWS